MDYSYLNQTTFDPAMTSAMAAADNSFYGDLSGCSPATQSMMGAGQYAGRYHSAASAMRSAYNSSGGMPSPSHCSGIPRTSSQDPHQARAAAASAAAASMFGSGMGLNCKVNQNYPKLLSNVKAFERNFLNACYSKTF